ncbi:hypothetical protein [Pleomorphomonas sp. PLEO]|uniref:hypothetical protein n=1 Tax=Pleomorphomonas sp. PLEO TaxID=3239306 RepID=UPI00351EF985
MKVELSSQRKLDAIIAQIDKLMLSDFPHPDSETALGIVRTFFEEHRGRLEKAARSGDTESLNRVCVTLNERITQYLPILGFLLRSTNVRNSFETYDAIVHIAKSLIGPQARVVMSSEWDASPLAYPLNVSILPGFALIGMPTYQSGNALILPLAGHELGHCAWVDRNLEKVYTTRVDELAWNYITSRWHEFRSAFPEHSHLQPIAAQLRQNMFFMQIIDDITALCLQHVEEVFCDAIGVALFGSSFALAFHYLLAPSHGQMRSLSYPELGVRARFIEQYGGYDLAKVDFTSFEAEFSELPLKFENRSDSFILRCADSIVEILGEHIFQDAQEMVAQTCSMHMPSDLETDNILHMFENSTPARAPKTLADIINAGWKYTINNEESFDHARRSLSDWVSELVLKSVEVLEFRRRSGNA